MSKVPIYGKGEYMAIKAHSVVRNNAAHAHYENVKVDAVEAMYKFVLNFNL